jgi:hypothetical protein
MKFSYPSSVRNETTNCLFEMIWWNSIWSRSIHVFTSSVLWDGPHVIMLECICRVLHEASYDSPHLEIRGIETIDNCWLSKFLLSSAWSATWECKNRRVGRRWSKFDFLDSDPWPTDRHGVRARKQSILGNGWKYIDIIYILVDSICVRSLWMPNVVGGQ